MIVLLPLLRAKDVSSELRLCPQEVQPHNDRVQTDTKKVRQTERRAPSWSLAALTPGKLFATMHTEGGYGEKGNREKLDKVKALFHMKSRVFGGQSSAINGAATTRQREKLISHSLIFRIKWPAISGRIIV